MPRSTRNTLLAVAALYVAVLLYRYIREGAFAYMTADWRRVMFVVVVTVLGTSVLIIGRSQAPLLRRPIHPALGLLGFGVIAGAIIGILDVAIASALWRVYGEPDGHFRGGWSGVVVSMVLETFAGAAAGLGFGGVLWLIESRFQRAIRFGYLSFAMLLVTLATFGLAHLAVFQLDWPHPFLIGHAIVFAGCSTVAFLLSKRPTSNLEGQQ